MSPTVLPMLSKIHRIPSASSFNKYVLNFYMHKALGSSDIPKCEKYVSLILIFLEFSNHAEDMVEMLGT